MAASAAAAGSFPGFCPSYAVICSFLERWGPLLDLPELSFSQLERYIQDTSAVPKLLVDLHVKLLRKIGKSVSADRWEKHLAKICQEFNTTWAWELEKKGYKDMTVESKTGILKYLCESQFDDNIKFKTAINDEDPEKMRLQPIGRDKDGLMYWFQQDQDNNVRVYVEEQDDLDGSSWKCIVRERNDLAEILALLKTQIDPSLLTKKEEEEGTLGRIKKIEDSSEDDEDMVCKATSGVIVTKTESKEEEEPSSNKEAELVAAGPRSPLKDVKDDRTESDIQPKKPDGDENVSMSGPAIKEEPMEVSTDRTAKEPLTEKPPVPLQTDAGEEEAKKKSAEELQRAIKNDQQAKIPLKKREMKLSEDFDNGNSGSIIVRNLALPQVKDPQKVNESGKDTAVRDTPVDQVNDNTQRPTDTSLNKNGLKDSPQKDRETQKDSTDGKEKTAVAESSRESEVAEAKDKNSSQLTAVLGGRAEDKQKALANNSEEAMEVTGASDAQNEAKAAKEVEKNPSVKTKELIRNEVESVSATKSLPSSKDEATPPPGNSSDVRRDERLKKCEEVAKEPEGKKEAALLTLTGSSSKMEDPEKSQEKVTSKDSKPAEIKKTEKGVLMKGPDKSSDCERTEVVAKEPERSNLGTERQAGSKLSKTPALIKEDEASSSNKDSRKTVSIKDTETSSVIQKTETLTPSKNTEKLDSAKETSTSSVIKRADKPSCEKDKDSTNSGKDKGEQAVIQKMETEERLKPVERFETSVVTKEKSEHSTAADSKGKDVTCVSQKTETNPEAKDTEKRTSSQLDEPKQAEKLATSVDKTSIKETEKMSAKMMVKTLTKDKENICSKDAAKETEKTAKSSATDTAKESIKDKEKISTKDAAMESTKTTDKTSANDTEKESKRDKISSKETENVSSKDTVKTSAKDTVKESTKETEKASARDTEKESTKGTEKASAKDTEKESTKETEKASAKDTRKKSTKETEKTDKISETDTAMESRQDKGKTSSDKPQNPSSPIKDKPEACKGKEEPAERKTDAAKEATAVPTADSRQLPLKTPAADKESKEESAEISPKKSTDKNTSVQKDSKKDPVEENKSDTSSVNEVEQDKTPMDCEEPLKEQVTKTKPMEIAAPLMTTEGKKDKRQDSKASEDAGVKGCPETETGEKNKRTEKDDTKPEEVSTDDKPDGENEKEDKDEEKDPEEKENAAETDKGSSEVQEEGIRLKIKIPAHRRKTELLREERGDSESDTGEGRSLRRSPRICRPTSRVVEFQDQKLERKQATPRVEKGEEEEEEEEKSKEKGEEEEDDEAGDEEKALQKKTREKKLEEDGQPKTKGRKRRRTRWSNTRTRRKKKGSEEEGGSDEEEDYESSDEDDSEDEDDSDEDYKVERNRKRRNRNRQRRSSGESTSSDDDLPPNDDPCKHCGLPNHPELILLCDSCDNGYHTACLRPPLMIIPDGEWFCPPCQHKQLCDRLEEQLLNLDTALKKRERAERRKERLVYVGISVENIITPSLEVEEEKEEEIIKVKKEVKKSKSWGRRSTRAKKSISYRFDEFDEAIEEAIEEDIKEAEGGGAGRGKDMANITGHRGKDMSTILQGEEGKENGRPPKPTAGQRRKKRRRLNDLDSDSTMEEEESEDEFRLSDSTEEEEFVVSDNDAESDADVNSNSDAGSNGSGPRHRSSRTRKPVKRRKGARQPPRRRRRPRGYSDDEEEEETDEEEEEEIATEGSSEFSDSDLDMSRRRSRRSRKQQVNYCETSESEGSRAGANRHKVKSQRRLASSDSEASLSKGSDNEERERRVSRRADSLEEGSRQRRRRLSLKRRRASEDDDDDDSDSEEEERPVRKRVNRIDSDDDSEEEKKQAPEQVEEEEGPGGKGATPLEYNLVELPPTNGQSPVKVLEGLMNRPGAGAALSAPDLLAHLGPKAVNVATPVVAIAPNGLVSQEMASQEDDEDDLLGVTDLVDYVCNSEQL